jgi:DNA-directed RNA polymerase omega subunit
MMNETIRKNFPAVMSRFQLVILAGLRSKQLLQGAHPRILADPLKKRSTSIALEELKLGLVRFKGRAVELLQNVDRGQASGVRVQTETSGSWLMQ